MNAPDYRHGYLRVPLSVWLGVYCQAPLTRRQLQLVSIVIRESWGWQTRAGEVYLWTRPLTVRRIAELTGLATDHLARDLRTLVTRGVLLEQARRYQFVPDPTRWLPPRAQASQSRPLAPHRPAANATTALPAPELKTANKDQRNVPPSPERQLSPAGDKSSIPRRSTNRPAAPRSEPAFIDDRFVSIIEAFAGTLPDEQVEELRSWVAKDGVKSVWAGLEEAFRHGPRAVRRSLKQRLTGPRTRPGARNGEGREEAADA